VHHFILFCAHPSPLTQSLTHSLTHSLTYYIKNDDVILLQSDRLGGKKLMIMLSKLFLSIAIIIIFLSLLVISSTEFQLEKFPHIVLILADDLGYGDVSSYNPKPMGNISTPNIDKMTKQGMMFMDAHASSSVCTPSRYSLLTGHYNWRTNLKHGVLNGFSSSLIERNRSTLATVLKSVGYQTACVGKW
jgi:arylsulfatase A